MMLRKQKMYLSIAGVCILIAGIIFFFNNIRIPALSQQIEKNVREKLDVNAMPRTKAAVVTDKSGITKYTVLTDQIIDEKIELVDIPIEFTAEGTVIDLDMLRGKIAKEDLRYKEQIAMESLSSEKKWFGDYDRLKEYEVKSIVADEAKAGNIIDIAVSYGNGKYDVVVPKTKIKKLIKETDKEKNKEIYTVIIAVDEVMYRDLELAGRLGSLTTRLYLDESQPASPKTFDYFSKIGQPMPSGLGIQPNSAGTAGIVQ